MDVAATLTTARQRAGLTQTRLADLAGTSQTAISAYEAGRKQPSVATLARLLAATGTRLTVEHGRPDVVLPSASQRARSGRLLADALTLAAALPVSHRSELAFPRLPARRVPSAA